jgi:hypothetical protein
MISRNRFGIAVFAFFFLMTCSAIAADEDDSAGYSLLVSNDESAPPPPPSARSVEPTPDAGYSPSSCLTSTCCPRWTASAEFICFERIGSIDRTLVERVPGPVPPTGPIGTGPEALNANDLRQGFSGGPKLSLLRHNDSGYDLELVYFQIDGWNSAQTIGPDNPPDQLVMRAPGGFVQTQDHPTQAMEWGYASKLYNAEVNFRWNPWKDLNLLAGFRWINLSENLQGTLMPADGFPPFWNSNTNNNLYGLQIGADGKIWERGRFSLIGMAKAGVFDNSAEEFTGVSIFKVVRPSQASTHHASFVGETGLQLKYQFNKGLLFKVGYEAIWLQGVALAPAQIDETVMSHIDVAQASGVNCDNGVFYHGATAGLEYSF